MTTDSDSECSYVANLAGFNVMRVIIIVIKLLVIKIVYNNKKSVVYLGFLSILIMCASGD